MKISIIIPTLNEERYLPKILSDLQKQSLQDFEVIVADAGSKDKTKSIAKEYGARVVKGGKPAVGRNNGAKVAKGELLFFLDADVRISSSFLKKIYDIFYKNYMELATCRIVPLSNNYIDRFLHDFTNLVIELSQYTNNPNAPGFCILMTRRLFDRVGGFDETLTLSEDHDLIKRASKFRRLYVIRSVNIKVSVRRLTKEGRVNLALKYFEAELYRRFVGDIRKDIIKYEFGNYDDKAYSRISGLRKEIRQLFNKVHSVKGMSRKDISRLQGTVNRITDSFHKIFRKNS